MKRVATALFTLALTLGINPVRAAEPESAAVVDGVRIEQWEIEREFQNLLPYTSFHRRVEGDRRTELERQALKAVIIKELKRQWAAEADVVVDPSEIDRELTEIRGRFSDDTAYERALDERRMSDAGLRRAIERDHLAKAVDERVVSAVPEPTSDDVERYFMANRSVYVTPESRHVIHLLVYVAPSAGAAVWESAGKEAMAVADSARAGATELLAEAVRRRSDIPPRYRDQTGDIGNIHRGALQAGLDDAVFSAELEEVIGPIRTIYGHSVLQVLSVEAPQQLELQQVREAVFSRMRSERRKAALAEFEDRLMTSATIEWGSSSVER